MSDLHPASQGVGKLLQRDYWATILGCRLNPQQLIELVATRFPEFAPPDLVEFRRVNDATGPLQVGDEMTVAIRMAGTFGVRVIHRNPNSLTIATVRGHPEAGRITFGAYRNDRGDVIFHIRSRARSSTAARYAGFLAGGDAMQANCWTDFVDAVAHTAGEGVIGWIHAETTHLPADEHDAEAFGSPTYLAEGD